MDEVLIQQFIQLISANTGLHIREQDRETLCKKIWARMKLLNLSSPENYYQLLQTGKNQSNSLQKIPPYASLQPLQGKSFPLGYGEHEWRELTLLLTTGESYFFRDKGQFTLLKTQILPKLIKHRREMQYTEGEAKPSLRIWSAGCSTGEEPYSLAILVKELIPDYEQWNILILGTDINPESIEKAKRGIYNSWSFRMVEPDLQKRYFSRQKTSWKVDERIHKMVTLRSGNLMKDNFPSATSSIHNFDIILCRNVFIYFDSKAISVVLEKFCNTLRPTGYLVVGHTELQGQNLGQLQIKVFSESVIYQKAGDGEMGRVGEGRGRGRWGEQRCPRDKTTRQQNDKEKEIPPNLKPQKRSLVSPPLPPHSLSQAEILFHNGAYASAIKEAEQVIKEHHYHFGAYYLRRVI